MLYAGIEAGEWLVEQQQLRPTRDRARHQHSSPLPAGQLADLPRGELGEADLFEGVLRRRAIAARPTAERTHPAVAAHPHDVEDGDREVPVHLLDLGHVGDLGARLGDRAVERAHLATQRLDQTEDRLEQCRFPGAVRAHEPDDLASGDVQIDRLDRGRLAGVARPEVAHLEGECLVLVIGRPGIARARMVRRPNDRAVWRRAQPRPLLTRARA